MQFRDAKTSGVRTFQGKLSWNGAARAAVLLVATSACFAADKAGGPTNVISPLDIMRKVAQNELKAASDESNRLLFRGIKTTPKGSATRLYVETKEATAGEMIAENGQPLSRDQRLAEESRIERFINNPAELKKKCDQGHETADRTLKIVKALPEAFLFDYAGEQAGSEAIGRAGAKLVKLAFRPNPAYQPPSRVEEVLTGLAGYVLIDPRQFRLATIDGTLTKEVGFGWGILGHLNKGGRFLVQQANVSNDQWQVSTVSFNFTGKVLMVKTINVNATEVFSGFQRIPAELSFVQALEFMKHQSSALAAGIAANSVASNLTPHVNALH